MKLGAFFSVLLLLTSESLSQSNPYWQWLGPPDSEEVDQVLASGDTIYVGTMAHLWGSFDGGKSWAILDSIIGDQKADTFICQNCGLRDSITIFPVGSGPVGSIAVARHNPSLIYIVKGHRFYPFYQSIYRSSDAGRTWQLLSDTSKNYLDAVQEIYLSPFDDKVIFAKNGALGGIDQIYRSSDGGISWSYVSGNFSAMDHGVTIELAFDPNDSMKMYATGYEDYDTQFYISNDGGIHWLSTGYVDFAARIIIDPDTTGRIFLWPNNQMSNDGGVTWKYVGPNGLAGSNMFGVTSHDSLIYVSTTSGVFTTSDGGSNWQIVPGSEKFPKDSWVYSGNIALDMGKHIFVGGGNGVYAYDLPTKVKQVSSFPTTYRLYQNYPNPFNPSTTIKYALTKESKVVIEVYNVLGQLTETLVNENQRAGTHEVMFDGSAFPSGVYFCRIQTHYGSHIVKMVLLK